LRPVFIPKKKEKLSQRKKNQFLSHFFAEIFAQSKKHAYLCNAKAKKADASPAKSSDAMVW